MMRERALICNSFAEIYSAHVLKAFRARMWRKVRTAFAGTNGAARVFYSMRRAVMGEMDAARAAGMIAAKSEQSARATAATASANGFQEETP